MKLVIHTDGGSLHNPGPAACAYVIQEKERVLTERSHFLGTQTNNVAEYMGIIHALEELIRMKKNNTHISACSFVSDSLLLVNQIRGIYKVKQPHLIPLHQKIRRLIEDLGVPVSFTHTLREGNTHADSLVKKELFPYS